MKAILPGEAKYFGAKIPGIIPLTQTNRKRLNRGAVTGLLLVSGRLAALSQDVRLSQWICMSNLRRSMTFGLPCQATFSVQSKL